MAGYDRLREKAMELGAVDTKIIKVGDIRTGAWTRWKCQFGCPNYGKRRTCPPYAPTYEETQKFLAEYEDAMLVQFFVPLTQEDMKDYASRDRSVSNAFARDMAALEREAFLLNYYKAFALKAGTCYLCEKCTLTTCAHPDLARPSLEAVGIDVFALARDNGYEADVIDKNSRGYHVYCLLLIQ